MFADFHTICKLLKFLAVSCHIRLPAVIPAVKRPPLAGNELVRWAGGPLHFVELRKGKVQLSSLKSQN